MTTDITDFFAKSEYSKYYFLATSKEEYLYLSGLPKIDCEHESAKLKTYMPSYGSIEGYLVAKPVYYELLRLVNLETPYLLKGDTYMIAEVSYSSVHPIIIEEIKEAVGDY